MRLALIRHGATLLNELGHYQGQCDPPLSPTGEDECARACADVSGLRWAVICSSPQLRARATALALQGGVERVPVRVLADLRERHLGDIDGRCRRCVEAQSPGTAGRLIDDHDFAPPGGGESLTAVRTRALAALADLSRAGSSGGPAAVVTHGAVIAALTGATIGEVAPLQAAVVDVDGSHLTAVHVGIPLSLLPNIFEHQHEGQVPA